MAWRLPIKSTLIKNTVAMGFAAQFHPLPSQQLCACEIVGEKVLWPAFCERRPALVDEALSIAAL
jgi:hypothetical protein